VFKKIDSLQNMYDAWALVHICNITCLVIEPKSLHGIGS